VKNSFDPKEAQKFTVRYPDVPPELALRVYTSRLIGGDPSLVLHGGGNTSVKLRIKNIVGEYQEVLFVKGSGVDLAAIEPSGFVGLELEPLRKLRNLSHLPDEEMENQLQIHKIYFSSPDPSVEALLHAFLPSRYIDHTHADFILTLTNQRSGENFLKEALGSKVAIIPYLRPGLPLAKGVLERYEENPEIEAVVVAHHGIFTFGEDAKTAYERMAQYVNKAEAYAREKARGKAFGIARTDGAPPKDPGAAIARFNQAVRGACAFRDKDGRLRRFYVEVRHNDELRKASLSRNARDLCLSGVLTPDHVIRTKNQWTYIEGIPEEDLKLRQIVKEAVEAYAEAYDRYFSEQVKAKGMGREKLDPYPRVFLVAGVGIIALGFTRKEARIAADIAEHTLQVKLLANAAGEYGPISESHIFDMEYWPLQQKKLGRTPALPLQGQIAVITGAGGAIGLGIADRLLAAGSAVVISDIDESSLKKVYSHLTKKYEASLIESVLFDVTDYQAVEKAFQEISYRLGGLDILVPNAGVAHVARIEELDPEKFDRVISVNLKGTFNAIKAAIPIFRRQGTGGNIVVVSSKNVFDPGAAFGAYSASKAAAHQISKIAALELADLGVRVNLVNPDAVFGDEEVPSKLWELIGPDRMKSRGLDPKGLKEYYRQRNLLKVQVTPEHVGNAVVFFASEASGATTGATLPVDGGIPAAFPR
jgi:rhamnulose-1-phosphate aldolase/alcohol dehydrogenase